MNNSSLECIPLNVHVATLEQERQRRVFKTAWHVLAQPYC